MRTDFIAANFVYAINVFCYLGKYPVLGIDHFTVQMNNPADSTHLAACLFKFRTYISYTCCLPGTSLTVDQNI